MKPPTRLSEPALAVLRLFNQAEAKSAGSRLSREAIAASWKRAASDIDAGLAVLEEEGLLRLTGGEAPVAVLTEEGEAYFARFTRACH